MATATSSTPRKKPTPAKAPTSPADDLEPLPGFFGGDDDDDDTPAPPPKPKPARNVGSLLGDDGAPKPRGRALPAPEPEEYDDDDDDDEPAVDESVTTAPKTPHAAAIYWQEAKRVGPAHAKAALLKKLSERVKQHMAEVQKWGDEHPLPIAASGALRAALSSIEGAADSLLALPVGWAPPAKPATGGPKVLAEGAKVSIKEAARKEYDGVLEPKEMVGLTVSRHEPGKSKVACKTADGSRVVIPRAHLVLDASAPSAPAPETTYDPSEDDE